jgi:hypothetical protein
MERGERFSAGRGKKEGVFIEILPAWLGVVEIGCLADSEDYTNQFYEKSKNT